VTSICGIEVRCDYMYFVGNYFWEGAGGGNGIRNARAMTNLACILYCVFCQWWITVLYCGMHGCVK
jgi:hypothetical protein